MVPTWRRMQAYTGHKLGASIMPSGYVVNKETKRQHRSVYFPSFAWGLSPEVVAIPFPLQEST